MSCRLTARAAGLWCAGALLSAVAAEFRDPLGMTHEERGMVHAARGEYQDCMRQYAQAAMRDSDDPLRVADAAMKQCASVLEQLHETLTAARYSPEVASGFTRGISNRSARQVLAQVMQFMAHREAHESEMAEVEAGPP